jgi:hypothetical protein
MKKYTSSEIEYHAARIILLIYHCGSPVNAPKIKGRTLLAKLDFFLRYPVYLEKACRLRKGMGLDDLIGQLLREEEKFNVETRMIRYRYGPWDKIYFPVLSYLIAKNLIDIKIEKEIEMFALTDNGVEIAKKLTDNQVFQVLITRAKVLKTLFPQWTGSGIKSFIYENFPEVIALPLGKEI